MKKKLQKPESVHLKVLKGGGQGLEEAPHFGKNPLFFLLLFLALFLLGQILVGWFWGFFSQRSIKTILAGEGSLELTLPVSGLITFDEEIIFSPRPGFIYYLVEEGSRVPVGAELARISEFPLEEVVPAVKEEEKEEQAVAADYITKFKSWFLNADALDEDSALSLFPVNEEEAVVNPQAGLVSLKIDGWEKFGPDFGFPYLTEEEFEERPYQEQIMGSGDKVSRFSPLLRIINNYTWYFSAVIPVSSGELIAEQPRVSLYFPFAPDEPVRGEQVEVQRDEEVLKITWAINQYVENFHNQRWCTAEVAYEQIEGMMIPASALVEKGGQKGVYVIEKGFISYCEVKIIGEKEGFYLVENLNPYEKVVLNPDKVKEGQRFSW